MKPVRKAISLYFGPNIFRLFSLLTLTRTPRRPASTSGGGGGSYHAPASHLLKLEELRLLLDCPIDLSALAAFSPVPVTGDAGGLIRAVPRYWSPAAAAAAKEGSVYAVLVSSTTGMLGLPFLT
jgi:integrator complex subunit 9